MWRIFLCLLLVLTSCNELADGEVRVVRLEKGAIPLRIEILTGDHDCYVTLGEEEPELVTEEEVSLPNYGDTLECGLQYKGDELIFDVLEPNAKYFEGHVSAIAGTDPPNSVKALVKFGPRTHGELVFGRQYQFVAED